MAHKSRDINGLLHIILIISLLVVCSCSRSFHSAYSDGSSVKVHKCSAKSYSTSSFFFYKRWSSG